jgi:DNA mismatch endonuclease (patch repair protein)
VADIMSRQERSERMSRIRGKDTIPELVVRKHVWREGFRYRLHAKELPGKPDLVFPALRIAILVHGCYWHGHRCQRGRVPKTNSPFWSEKFATNMARDRRNRARLKALGWTVLTVWECELSTIPKRRATLQRVVERLRRAKEENSAKTLDSRRDA